MRRHDLIRGRDENHAYTRTAATTEDINQPNVNVTSIIQMLGPPSSMSSRQAWWS